MTPADRFRRHTLAPPLVARLRAGTTPTATAPGADAREVEEAAADCLEAALAEPAPVAGVSAEARAARTAAAYFGHHPRLDRWRTRGTRRRSRPVLLTLRRHRGNVRAMRSPDRGRLLHAEGGRMSIRFLSSVIVNPLHGYYRPERLEHVVSEMRRLGPPVLRAAWDADAGIWHAREGTHRLRAAKRLGLAPVIVPVPWKLRGDAAIRARFAAMRHAHTFEAVEVRT